ncbi:hypothetical protein ACGLHS_04225 [Variovorax sp. VaC1]|uniref:hypothetical protein n=1 Tax=Variovorax sp. VaC1 TaxID=3373132 RepID=UPI00374825E9
MRAGLLHGTVVLLAFGLCSAAMAQEAQAVPATKVEDANADSCVEVVVNGERTPSYACLTQKLRPTAPPRTADGAPPGLASEAITQRPSNQLGLFNRAATEHRMGNTFGTSVYPQRPPPVAPASPLIPRP